MMRGMGNMAMMQKVQKLQKEMMKAQQALEEKVYEASSPNDLVRVKMTGAHQVQAIEIKEELLDPEDGDMLQDLLVTTLNDILRTIEEDKETTLGKYTKGLNLPF